jgi:hypothetical protein
VEVVGTAVTAASDEFGKYGVKVAEKTYSIKFGAAGHQSKQVDDVVVIDGLPITLDVELDVI